MGGSAQQQLMGGYDVSGSMGLMGGDLSEFRGQTPSQIVSNRTWQSWGQDIGRLETDDDIRITFDKDPHIHGIRITASHPSGLRKSVITTDLLREGEILPDAIQFIISNLKKDIRAELDKSDPNFKPLPLKDILKGLKKEKPENIKEKVLNTIKKPTGDIPTPGVFLSSSMGSFTASFFSA